jgi:hypothetical protein
VWEADFRAYADRPGWAWEGAANEESDEFSEALKALSAELRQSRSFG